jgi:hypothetical protein
VNDAPRPTRVDNAIDTLTRTEAEGYRPPEPDARREHRGRRVRADAARTYADCFIAIGLALGPSILSLLLVRKPRSGAAAAGHG